MKNNRLVLWILTVLFAVLMSLPFLVPHCGFFSLFGIVPLLCMERIASLSGTRRVWIYHYAGFVLWNAFTTFWVCNATVGGGLFAVFANAFQMSLIFGLFRIGKRYFKGVLPYIFLAVAWIAWERFYFDAEISWPWLVLGNSFARSTGAIQWYEYTGTLGGSLWIWAVNLSIFGLMVALSDGSWWRLNAKARIASVSGTVILLFGPFILSSVIYAGYEEKENPVDVIMLQPNIDPYNKFQAMGQSQQNAILEEQMATALKGHRDSSMTLVLAPETFTGDIVTGDFGKSRTRNRFVSFLKDYPGVNLLFGASSHTYIRSLERPSYTARAAGDGLWVESHNSALMIDGTGRTEIFHKNRLVVAVEKTPYPAIFCRIDDWLGGVMGRCIGQGDISLLHCVGTPRHTDSAGTSVAGDLHDDGTVGVHAIPETIPVGCAICYESVYGEYYTGYVAKGAEIMTIITNDAWWKDTPGYRQHLSYASLRAIETRRSIARCANTGISAIIDQRGDIVARTSWWEPAVLKGTVNRNDTVTFFVRHGDITGRVCTFIFLLLFLALAVQAMTKK